MKHRLRTSLGLGLSATLLMATPALARPDDPSTRRAPAAAASSFGEGRFAAAFDFDFSELVASILDDVAERRARARPGRAVDVSNGKQLRAAIDSANNSGRAATISLRRGTYRLDKPGAGDDTNATGDLDVTGDITIRGNGSTIDLGGYGDRAFDVRPGGSLDVSDLSVIDAALPATMSGGAFTNAGNLTLSEVTASGNDVVGAGASGGAVFNTGTLHIERSVLSDNSAARAGGAIETVDGTVTVERSDLVGNRTGAAPGNGGAVHVSGTGQGMFSIVRSTVSGNTAAAEGGGLWAGAGANVMVVERTTVSDNVANGATFADPVFNGGGGLFNKGGTLVVNNSEVRDNTASVGAGSGGGILNLGTLELNRTDVSGNSAARAGGAIETVNGVVTIRNSSLTDNVTGPAPGNGGGVHQSGTSGVATIDRTVVSGNVAALEGGGLWAGAGGSSMTVTRSTITGNSANGTAAINGGGGLFNKGGFLAVTDSDVTRNVANVGSGSGGGILNLGTLEVTSSSISLNSAVRAGGGVESNNVNGAGNATLVDVRFLANTTGPTPGNGGAMHVTAPTAGGLPAITTVIDDSLVVGNRASTEGGGLWNFAGSTMTVTDTRIVGNSAPIAPNVFQNGAGGNFTVDGFLIQPGDNQLSFT